MASKFSRIMLIVLSGFITLSAAHAEDAGKPAVAATVNGVAIPQSQVDLLVAQATSRGQPDTPELRNALTNELVNRELLAQQATKEGLEKSAEVQTQLTLAKQTVLVGAYIQNYSKAHPITDQMIKAEYDKLKAQMPEKEYNVRHILVSSEADAKNIIAQLKKGAKFDKLAAEKSKDPGSKDNGGELGWITPGNVVKPFADAMVKLKKGQYTAEPVQTQYGWHVIQVEDVRALKAPPMDQVRAQIIQRLQQEAVQNLVADLRTKAKIQVPGASK